MKKTVGVIYGGESTEHEVSIRSAYNVIKNINLTNFEVLPIYINKKGKWHYQKVINEKARILSKSNNSSDLLNLPINYDYSFNTIVEKIDIFFPLIHGQYGEDGELQNLLEIHECSYVGSNSFSSSICIDKAKTKHWINNMGLNQSKYAVFNKESSFEEIIKTIKLKEINCPMFVKPTNSGSSIGITKIENIKDLKKGIDFALKHNSKIIIEEGIIGRELELGIIEWQEEIEFSSIGEVKSCNNFYDYEAKYNDEKLTEIFVPAHLPVEVENKIKRKANDIFNFLNCKDIARIDFFYKEKNNEILVNEVNTIPGFTSESLFPLLFKSKERSIEELITKILENAINNRCVHK